MPVIPALEAETGGSWVRVYTELHSRPCFKVKTMSLRLEQTRYILTLLKVINTLMAIKH